MNMAGLVESMGEPALLGTGGALIGLASLALLARRRNRVSTAR